MGWIIFTVSITLVCAAGVIAATARRAAPARHARRRHSARSAPHATMGQHSAGLSSTRSSGAGSRTGGQQGRWRSPGRHAENGGELAFMARHMHVLRRPAVDHSQDDDPFEVLALQCRLTALSAEIQRLEQDSSTIALAHHLRATQYAYDALLDEACRLIGVLAEAEAPPVPDESTGSWTVNEETRMRKELELCSRGWTW